MLVLLRMINATVRPPFHSSFDRSHVIQAIGVIILSTSRCHSEAEPRNLAGT